MDWDWAALAAALRARRRVLRLTQDEVAERADVSTASVKNYEQGKRTYGRIPRSATAIAEALGWTVGSVQAVLEGSEPTLLSAPAERMPTDQAQLESPTPLPPLKDRIPVRVRLEVEGGELLDTERYDLTVGNGARIITFLIIDPEDPGKPHDHEELRRTVREWEQFKRRQRGLKPLLWEPGDPEEWKTNSED